MSTALSAANTWQTGFLQLLPAVQTHARIQFRRLPVVHREEAVQEAITAACVSYRVLASRGRLHAAFPGTLATFAVKHVRSGRHVGGSQDGVRDVLSPVCQRRQHVAIESCDAWRPKQDGNDWEQLAIADRKDPIPDTVAFRIDFQQWLRMLSRRDRKLIGAFVSGEGTLDVADRFGLSPARVSQLRRQYELSWRSFRGENAAFTN